MSKLQFTTLSLLAALGLSACQTTNPYTGDPQTSRATSGAVIGGLIGAGLGSLVSAPLLVASSVTTWISRKPSSGVTSRALE